MSSPATGLHPGALDVHGHHYPPGYVAVVREVATEQGPHGDVARAFLRHPVITRVAPFLGATDRRLRLMDAAGIGVQVLGFASLTVWHTDPVVRSRLVAAYNDGCAGLVASRPDRFRFLASLPLPHVAASVAEVFRARDLPGCVGFSIPTHIDTVPVDSPRWREVYAAMAERTCLVMAHPDGFCAPGALADHGMEWALGAPFEDTIAVVRLLAGGLLEDFPALTWVVPHLGGTLPFLLHRMRWRWQFEAEHLGRPVPRVELLERLLVDSANCSAPTLRLAEEVLPPGRVVFGTDFPFVDPDDLRRPVDVVRGLAGEDLDVDGILTDRLAPHLLQRAPALPAPTPRSPR